MEWTNIIYTHYLKLVFNNNCFFIYHVKNIIFFPNIKQNNWYSIYLYFIDVKHANQHTHTHNRALYSRLIHAFNIILNQHICFCSPPSHWCLRDDLCSLYKKHGWLLHTQQKTLIQNMSTLYGNILIQYSITIDIYSNLLLFRWRSNICPCDRVKYSTEKENLRPPQKI